MIGRCILLVEDHPGIRNMLRFDLQREGFEVVEAGCVADGIRLAASVEVDLILLDLRLPDGSGWDVLRAESTGARPPIPVIVMSAEPPDRAIMRAFKPAAYLQKPFGLADVITCVRATLAAGENQALVPEKEYA